MQISTYNQPGRQKADEYYNGVMRSTSSIVVPGAYVRTGTSAGIVKGNKITPNAWSWNYESYETSHGTYDMYDGMCRTAYSGTISTNYGFSTRVGNVPGCIPSSPYNKALQKLYDSLRQDVDLSIDVYQGGQALRMLKDFGRLVSHPVKTLANAMGSLVSSGKIRKGSDLISRKWLEWQYGIRPSIDTVSTLLGDLKKAALDGNGFLVARARASNALDFVHSGKHGPSNSLLPYTVEVHANRRCEIGIRYGIANAQLNALSQFTALSPVSFLYENIPYSFVVDWVYDIGGYLRSMETACMTGLELKSGYVSDLVHVENVGKSKAGITDNYRCTHIVNLKSKSKYASFSRTVLGGMPLPMAPTFDPKLGTQRLLSAASLLRGLLSH